MKNKPRATAGSGAVQALQSAAPLRPYLNEHGAAGAPPVAPAIAPPHAALTDDQIRGCNLNEHQAAAYLNCKVSTLRRWRVAGKGPAYKKIGALVRYDGTALIDFCNQQVVTSTSIISRGA